jgi:predicted nucleic acid-binding protein
LTLADTNVLLDVVTNDARWAGWSRHQLEAASLQGAIWINDVIYAELSVRFARIEDLDATLAIAGIECRPLSRAALFLAGKAFVLYRQAGGTRGSLLPDFFIGAQAAIEGLVILTRDPRRYRSYFPTVALVAPEKEGRGYGPGPR